MVAKEMHILASEGLKTSCAFARCKMAKAKRKRLANVGSVLGTRGGSHSLGRAEAAACEERECGCGCGCVCVYLPYTPLPRENCITSPTNGLAVMDSLPTISISDPFTPLALLASSLVPNWLLKAIVDTDDVNSVLGMGLGLPIRLQYYANKALKPMLS